MTSKIDAIEFVSKNNDDLKKIEKFESFEMFEQFEIVFFFLFFWCALWMKTFYL